ncbi:MAG: molybdenum cofactor guanylyltransferase, partial [Acidobacteriota bacterium]|nr:molybdenum cofactor guanylyltransferase [Acidobacteriota bacterium]
GGETFTERAVAAVRGISKRVHFVVSAAQNDETELLLPSDIPRVTDLFPNKAALGGIYTALAHSRNEWTAILACDFPFVTKDLFARFAEFANDSGREVAAVVPVQTDGRVQPLCALYRTKICLKAAEEYMKQNEIQPARRLAEKVPTRLIQFEEIKDLPGSENFFWNVNTQADYLHAQKTFQQI